ncbi:MAG: type II toxin-antitoxin system mRNA interferase toxin, RelE/StbE family [Candidatus Yanofskybacteria bacterium]|nr:type II toxin-antitoxin system mRNA interferase toxin, RelE/StbE family [Candidatus Yanofskybacteria bacterium]
MKIFYYSKFKQQFKKLPKEIKSLATKKEKIFRINPFDLHPKTHKLHGELNEFWAFSINHQYRIIFDFADKNIIRFYAVGKHNIY